MPHNQTALRTTPVISLFAAFVSIFTTAAFAHTPVTSAPQHVEGDENVIVRLERLKNEINSLKKENDEVLKTIEKTREMNRCLGEVVSRINALARQLNDLGERHAVGSFSERALVIATQQAEYFTTLSEFSKNGFELVGPSKTTLTSNSTQFADLASRLTEHIQHLRNQYDVQAEKEQKFLGDLSLAMRRLKDSGFWAQRSLESAQTCAPQMIDKTKSLIDVAKQIINKFEKNRAMIADLQMKRSRVLGASAAGIQKKLIAQWAELSGDSADRLISALNLSLAELSLRTDAEKWWFTEVLEKGPARGLLKSNDGDQIKAVEVLKLAIVHCDFLITRVKELVSEKNLSGISLGQSPINSLEVTLYQRREALNRWLAQSENSFTITLR